MPPIIVPPIAEEQGRTFQTESALPTTFGGIEKLFLQYNAEKRVETQVVGLSAPIGSPTVVVQAPIEYVGSLLYSFLHVVFCRTTTLATEAPTLIREINPRETELERSSDDVVVEDEQPQQLTPLQAIPIETTIVDEPFPDDFVIAEPKSNDLELQTSVSLKWWGF